MYTSVPRSGSHNASHPGIVNAPVSPGLVVEAVRHWMQQDMSGNTFQRVVFSSSANAALVESIMCSMFPPSKVTDRGGASLSSETREAKAVENKVHPEGGLALEEAGLDDVMMQMQGLISSLENEADSLRTASLSPNKMGRGGLEESKTSEYKDFFLPKFL